MRSQSRILIGAALSCLFSPMPSFGAAPDRILGPIETNRHTVLRGNVHPMARPEYEQGPVEAAQRISGVSLDLPLGAAQQKDLDAFLEEQRNPASPNYRNWLTPEQFADRFGSSPNDVAKIVSWLQAQGFTIEHIGAARTWILFGGTAGQMGQTFHTSLRRYLVNGAMHYANDAAPSIPEALDGIVGSIRGLDDFRPQPMLAHAQSIAPELNRGGYHYLGPDDIAAIYDVAALYKAGADGTGQKLAIAGQTDINLLDIQEFRGLFNISANVPQVVLVGKDPGTSPGDEVEADLDIEWAGAVARNATIIYVNSNNVFTSLQYAIDRNLAPVISMSYGGCELGAPASFRTIAQQASAQGITWMNASGDQGAAGCDYGASVASYGPAVIFPADIPEVVAVGGTEFNETGNAGWSSTNGPTGASALGYIPEKAWNDTSPGNPIEASGGGASVLFNKPWWQTGPGVPNDGARDVPDVALAASADHDAYLIVTSDTLMSVGGTSAASPSFAGIVTLLNQYLTAKGTIAKPGLGNINPTLYALARSSPGIFHDITVGNNIVPCAAGSTGCSGGSFGYDAGPGYDLVTGLGSVDAYNLATGWTSVQPGVGVTMKMTATPSAIAASASVQVTATVAAVTGTNPPTGSVLFTLGGATIGSAGLVAGSGASASTATATLTVKGSALTTGANTISANYLPTGSFLASSSAVTVTVTPPPVATTTAISASPATVVSSASTLLTATVKPASGNAAPTGTVTFTFGNTTLGSAALSNSTASLTVKGGSLVVGTNAIAANFAATGNFSNSSGSTTVVVTPTPVSTTTTVAASPASIASSASTVLTATVKAASSSVAPTGTVTFTLGNTTLGSAAVSNSAASLTVKGSSLALGSNTITASFSATGNFSNSSGSVTVVVTAPPVSTTTTITASSASIASSASTVLTATVKAASGSTAPTGTVTFTVGSTQLGTATLTGASGNATATFTVKGTSFIVGTNTITVSYSGSSSFSASSGTISLTVTGSTAISTHK